MPDHSYAKQICNTESFSKTKKELLNNTNNSVDRSEQINFRCEGSNKTVEAFRPLLNDSIITVDPLDLVKSISQGSKETVEPFKPLFNDFINISDSLDQPNCSTEEFAQAKRYANSQVEQIR